MSNKPIIEYKYVQTNGIMIKIRVGLCVQRGRGTEETEFRLFIHSTLPIISSIRSHIKLLGKFVLFASVNLHYVMYSYDFYKTFNRKE